MRAANLDDTHVKEFCAEISPHRKPLTVRCAPQNQSPYNECFGLVDEKITESGGKQIIGWAIWEKTGVFIEAEFHAVWETTEGNLLDLNPRPPQFCIESILFVPDANKTYSGRQVDNIRKPLVSDPDVVRFLYLASKRFQLLNRGDRAYQHGKIQLKNREAKEYQRISIEARRLNQKINKRYGFSSF
jgi:hypothetical protein